MSPSRHIGTFVASMSAALERSADEAALGRMDDRELADLGLGRSGIAFAVRHSRDREGDSTAGHSDRPTAKSETDSRRAWLTVAAAFVAGFVVFGTIYSFGSFVEPMVAEFQASRLAAALLFSAASLAFYALGPFTGYLSDRFGPRRVVGIGAVLAGAGLALTAFIDRIEGGYLTYGVGVGVGAACAYVPTLAVVGGWFVRRRGLALGIAACGTGCGMLMVPPLSATLIELYGWRVADLILGIGCAGLLLVSALMTRRAPSAEAPIAGAVAGAVRSRAFALLYGSWLLSTTALFVPLAFLPAFALDRGASQVAASALISVLGGMSVVGRLGLGFLGDWVSTLRLFKAATLVMGASYVLWLTADTYGWLLLFAAVLGLGYGVRIALMPIVLIELFGLKNLGAVLGVFFTATGISSVVGPPLAGFIVDFTSGYRCAAAFALVAGLLGFAVVLRLKTARP